MVLGGSWVALGRAQWVPGGSWVALASSLSGPGVAAHTSPPRHRTCSLYRYIYVITIATYVSYDVIDVESIDLVVFLLDSQWFPRFTCKNCHYSCKIVTSDKGREGVHQPLLRVFKVVVNPHGKIDDLALLKLTQKLLIFRNFP